MAEKPQSFQNHARLHPIFHLVLIPILFINVIIAAVLLVRFPGWPTAWATVMAFALFLLALLVRMNPVKVQDRVIRLEERLRLTALLPDPLRARISELSERQLIALRFAPDDEIPALVQKTLNENLAGKQIKQAINNWRPDHWRV
jgi:hypothetical protein